MSDPDRQQRRGAAAERPPDLLVVGAGVIGLSIAWRAAAAGLAVTVIDRDAAGTGTSAVAAGMLAPVGEASWGEEVLLRAGLRSAAIYPDFIAGLARDSGIDVGYRRCGALHVAVDRDEAAELRRRHELHASLGVEASWVDRDGCRELEPGLAPAAGPGIHAPGDGEVDPRRLLGALIAACRRRGVELHEHRAATRLRTGGGRVVGIRTEAGEELRAGQIVIAVGSWAGSGWLAPELELPVRPVKGELVRLRAVGEPLPCERLIVTERVYLVPRRTGELVVGATTEERGFDTSVSAGGVHELLREAYRVLPEVAELEFSEAVAGLRPATPDNLPVVGAAGPDGLLVAAGHYRNGILLAPLTAEIIVALASGAEPPEAAELMSPLRFDRAPAGVSR